MYDATCFYNFQMAMEDIHAHTYSILINDIIPSRAERDRLTNAITTMPVITKMTEYMHRCIASDAPLPERLLRMACVEGIFFSGCFCVIYWFQSRALMPALGHTNELIAIDEGLHTAFALYLYTLVKEKNKLSPGHVRGIFTEAVEIATEFINDALPTGLTEMNAALMTEYIQCQADNLVTLIDIDPIYNVKHNFPFMDQINFINRTNFFERRVSDYSKKQGRDESDYSVATEF